jgi:lipopolysaccharide biosynthesis glycosyltransferase
MKVAFTTVLDDKYLVGFLITLNSMLRVSKGFNHDVIILEWGELSDDSKSVIKSLYDRVIFKKVNCALYENQEYDDTWRKWTYNCNYRFDIFTLTEYDRVVFFDSDIIFEIDIDELLKYDVDFGACGAGMGRVTQIGDVEGFDGGIMSIGKRYLNEKTRDELIKIANSPAPYDKNIKTNKWVSDEPILNVYFLDKITWLPEEFNFLISKANNNNINRLNNYQFTGHNKPWYGNKLEEQFNEFAFDCIKQNDKIFMIKIVLRKIVAKYNLEVKDLLAKNIDIKKYSTLKPIT